MTTIQIIRKKLDPAEVGGANTRYNDDCDCIQTTPDDGTTWNDNPGLDPRHNAALQLPPRGGADPQCDAAANMRAQLEKFINTILTVATQGAGASAILGVLIFFMPAVAILWTLALEIMGGLLTIGQSTINAAFTSGVYDQLECIFYCHIGGDGTCSAAQLAAIEEQIGTDIGGVVQAVMALYLSILGEVGLTNSGAIGAETGDCSGCDCGWCLRWDGAEIDDDWVFDFGPNGSLSSYCHLVLTIVHIDVIEFGWLSDGVGEGGTSGAGIWDATGYSHNLILESPLSGADNPLILTNNASMDWIGLGANADGGSGGHVTITYIRLTGRGTAPAIGTPCAP